MFSERWCSQKGDLGSQKGGLGSQKGGLGSPKGSVISLKEEISLPNKQLIGSSQGL